MLQKEQGRLSLALEQSSTNRLTIYIRHQSTYLSVCKHGPELRPRAENGQNFIDVGVPLDWVLNQGFV